MKKIIIFILVTLLGLSLFACKPNDLSNEEAENSKIIVAVGVVPEATFVQKVAGDLVDIVTLIPPGNSPANYQPTAIQMQKFSDAKVYFAMQTPTEVANILPKVSDFNKDIEVVYLRDEVSAIYPNRMVSGHTHEDEHEEEHADENEGEEETVDPHIWLSPKRVIMMVQIIAEELSEIDSENAQTYKENAEKYIKELEELDAEIKQTINGISGKAFMIYHGTYGYFADDYGLTMITLENDGKAATATQMQEVIDFARDEGIATVYYQEEFDDTQARTIAQEINGSVTKVTPLSADYINTLKDFVSALIEQGE